MSLKKVLENLIEVLGPIVKNLEKKKDSEKDKKLLN
jgi:hypothetical protein